MTKRQVAFIGGFVGLIVPIVVLTLFSWFGVWSIVRIGSTDLTHILWPFSVMITVAWQHTGIGILTTAAAVTLNCLVYIAAALLLRAFVTAISDRSRGRVPHP